MKKLLFAIIFLVSAISSVYSVNLLSNKLDNVTSLLGVELSLPLESECFAIIAESKESIDDVKAWIRAIENERLLPKHVRIKLFVLFGDSLAVRFSSSLIIQALKLKTPKHRWDIVYPIFKNRVYFRKMMHLAEEDVSPLTIILYDKQGKVNWQYSGVITDGVKRSLKYALSNL